jgi:drug/metabolite transporter (DMT)-like permease
MSGSSGPQAWGVALAIGAGVLFAFNPALAKIGSDAGASKMTLMAGRFLAGFLILLPFTAHAGALRQPARSVAASAVMGVSYVGNTILYWLAIDRIPLGVASILLYLYPTMVTVLARVLLHESLTRMKLLALLLASGGATLAVGATSTRLDAIGVAMAVLVAVLHAGYIILGARLQRGMAPLAASTWVLASGAAFALIAGAALSAAGASSAPGLGRTLSLTLALPTDAWLSIAAMAIFCTAPPILAFLDAVRRVGASRASILSMSELAASILFGALLFGETLSPLQWLGAALVVGGVLLVSAPQMTQS